MGKMNRRKFVHHSIYAAAGATFLPMVGKGQIIRAGERRLRVAQIGTRHDHASGKIQALRALPQLYEFVALAETDPHWQQMASGRAPYSGVRWMEIEKLLEMDDLDLVVLETGCEEAPELARRALNAGKHVHLDKPGARNHTEFISIRRLAEERGLILQMGYMLRHLPVMQFLFQIVNEGWLGEILEIEASMGRVAGDEWLQKLALIPGGGMFELGCHQIDLVVNVLGEPHKIHAFSAPSPDGIAAKAADNQLAVLEYPGAIATVRINLSDPFRRSRRFFNVAGTAGTIEVMPLESGKARLFLKSDRPGFPSGTHELAMPFNNGRYGDEFIALANAIQGNQPLPWNANHDIVVHATSLRAAGVNIIELSDDKK